MKKFFIALTLVASTFFVASAQNPTPAHNDGITLQTSTNWVIIADWILIGA